jgi:tetratricopeptide (TPR) repeat protein
MGYWQSGFTLFSHALEVTTGNGIAEDNLGAALMDRGRPDQALAHFEAAVRLIPQSATPHYNLATVLQRNHQLDRAMREYQLALAYAFDPIEAAQAHNNLGVLFTQRNQARAALLEFDAAIRDNPNEQNSYLGRGLLEYQQLNLDAALPDFSRAAQIAPSPLACFWLGRTLEDKGEPGAAVQAYEAALQLAPGMNEARTRLEALRRKLQK